MVSFTTEISRLSIENHLFLGFIRGVPAGIKSCFRSVGNILHATFAPVQINLTCYCCAGLRREQADTDSLLAIEEISVPAIHVRAERYPFNWLMRRGCVNNRLTFWLSYTRSFRCSTFRLVARSQAEIICPCQFRGRRQVCISPIQDISCEAHNTFTPQPSHTPNLISVPMWLHTSCFGSGLLPITATRRFRYHCAFLTSSRPFFSS